MMLMFLMLYISLVLIVIDGIIGINDDVFDVVYTAGTSDDATDHFVETIHGTVNFSNCNFYE